MRRHNLKVLIVSTPRTGNTWIKYALSLIYNLPVVEFPTPDFWRPFDCTAYDSLGDRWVAHEHLPPFDPLVRWAKDRNVKLITTVRHPADTLISLYHYVRNFAGRKEIDAETVALLSSRCPTRHSHPVSAVEALQLFVQEKFFKTVHFSIAWLRYGLSYGVRYEDLWHNPGATLRALTDEIRPVPSQQVARAIERSHLREMRKHATRDAAFFQGGGQGYWETALPEVIVHMLARLPPYPSQLRWLGCELNYQEVPERFSRQLGERLPPPVSALAGLPVRSMCGDKSPASYYRWLNSPSQKDREQAHAPPRITNLGRIAYDTRLDLQASFADLHGRDRVAFSHWFTEAFSSGDRRLDPYFVVPVYESWLTDKAPCFKPIHLPS
ncbi:MAG: sulfotransferase domain-containing protein [Verrucomicrobia bacterium]|nr:sulfotransferase domain-containing protein [Verrucomicrobiota bacterium]